MSKRLLMFIVATGLCVALLHMLGIYEGFYWSWWWWSVIVHIFGGIWIGLLTAWIQVHRGRRVSLVECAAAALLAGAAWEIFEYIEQIGASPFMSYGLNTSKDIIDDVIGGVLSYYLARTIRS